MLHITKELLISEKDFNETNSDRYYNYYSFYSYYYNYYSLKS